MPAEPSGQQCPGYPIPYDFAGDLQSTIRSELDRLVAAHDTNWFNVRFHAFYRTMKNAELKIALHGCDQHSTVESEVSQLIRDWPGVFMVDLDEWTLRKPEQAGLMCADLQEGQGQVFWLKRQRIGELFFLPRSGGEIGLQLKRDGGIVYLVRVIGSYLPHGTRALDDAKDAVYACGTPDRRALEDAIEASQVPYVYFYAGSCTIEGEAVYDIQPNDVLTWDSEGWTPIGETDVFFQRWRRATLQIHPDNMTEILRRSSAGCGFEVYVDVVSGEIIGIIEDWNTCIIC